MDDFELIQFAENYRLLHKESRAIIIFLLKRPAHTWNGTQTKLMKECGYIPYVNDKGKMVKPQLGQFRNLGILELLGNRLIGVYRDEESKAYTFILKDEWKDIISRETIIPQKVSGKSTD